MESRINAFWQWFTDNTEQLTMLSELSDSEQKALVDQLQLKLTEYCDGLTCEVGEPTPAGRTLTFSAEGDTDLFRPLVELVDAAPDVDWWKFVAFRQPKGKDLRVVFANYVFETRKMYFQQLENEYEPGIIGLRIALPDPQVDNEDFNVGVYVTVEAVLGEFECATKIGYIELCQLPPDPKSEGFHPLDDLPNFVEWFSSL